MCCDAVTFLLEEGTDTSHGVLVWTESLKVMMMIIHSFIQIIIALLAKHNITP
jgi:hypothetical protein